MPGWLERVLRRWLPFKDIGWAEIGEEFTRWTLLRTPWWRLYLHRVDCRRLPPTTHDHPWWFAALVLGGGYDEWTPDGRCRRRRPGCLHYHRAEFAHAVRTRGVSWSLVLVGRRRRSWGFRGATVPAHCAA